MDDDPPFAVRWALRKVRNEFDYTKWHRTDDAFFTVCGLAVRMAVETFFPETEDLDRVDCRRCLARIKAE